MAWGFGLPTNFDPFRPRVTLGVQSQRTKQFIPVSFIADSGNDVTLINRATAQMLGIDHQCMVGSQIHVQGVGGQASPYCLHSVLMVVGRSPPFPVTIAVGNVSDNLLGRHNIFDRFKVVFEANKVSFLPTAGYSRCCFM